MEYPKKVMRIKELRQMVAELLAVDQDGQMILKEAVDYGKHTRI